MPRISAFRKKGTRGAAGGDDDDDDQDEMTITSGWSVGQSSVSDRIMGRMKKNLTFTGKGGAVGEQQQNFSSSSSVGSRMSTGRFGGKRGKRNNDDMGIYSGGHSVGGGVGRRRSESVPKFRGSGSGSGTSSVGIEAMEEMDSSEAMALKGKSMGRRSLRKNNTSAPPGRMDPLPSQRFSRRNLTTGTHQKRSPRSMRGFGDVNVHEPVEYSLAELRAMHEGDLEQVMHKAGVPTKDIADTLNEASKIDASVDSAVAEDQRKNSLVALFVNSGHVKLVAKETKSSPKPSPEMRKTISSLSEGESQRNLMAEEGSRRALSPIKSEQEDLRVSFPSSEVSISDERSAKSTNTNMTNNKLSKKSKLEKIAELKTDNTNMKRENKSLKKTVKKLLGQLTTAISEKDDLQKAVTEGEKERAAERAARKEGEVVDELQPSTHSLHSIQETKNAEPPFDVLVHGVRDDESVSVKSVGQSVKSSAAADKNITYLKRKLKKEKEAHQNTEFRLKAELEILSKEVEGLQRELGLTLESLDSAKKRSRESRESASSLKRQLRSSAGKVKELKSEAEARDKLIETFTNILLQRVGVEEGGGGGDGKMLSILSGQNLKDLEEEKMGDELPADEEDESYTALKVL